MNKSYRLFTILFMCLVLTPGGAEVRASTIGDGLIIRVMDRMLYIDSSLTLLEPEQPNTKHYVTPKQSEDSHFPLSHHYVYL